jgi:arsenate reductase
MAVTPKRKILFLCTGNSCRSQMAEALLRHDGGEAFEAASAGSHPAGFIHQLAVEAMQSMGVSMEGQSSKGWHEFAGDEFDAVITLCDAAAQEACPAWPGDPVTAHWSLPDPAYHSGTDEERIAFALRVAERLRVKIAGLLQVDAGPDAVKSRLDFLGEI